ncbi:STAS domain-containing protein [Amycolatopsis sp., V23-08]|uniref:STAS domain-containing protein n=1 Tax=Amycolatopsis heterodermiae TaxID=3110235 RepID=A0ABU5R8Q8_9PSEU|nr:STAS domain-containing protein [Amycolatopsis sp., V23-08]MEA5362596.1 STAS domain-containing protein [Amycolatopsis sp., V23-08]
MNHVLPLTCSAVEINAATVRIDMAGDLEFARARALQDLAATAPAQAGLRTPVLDFAERGFPDSSGLSTLPMIHRNAATAGARLRLQARTHRLDLMLRRTGLYRYLVTDPNAEPAPREPVSSTRRRSCADGTARTHTAAV